MRRDADALREVLVRAIADNHPAWPGEISSQSYTACRHFLAHFKNIYTLNYDLLLYWALMQDEIDPPQLRSDDGFRTSIENGEEYVTWESGRHGQNIFYLHGALHVFDAGTEVQKYTWANTGVRLIEQVRAALQTNRYPIFVAEGESSHKLVRIRHSDFLAKAYRSFQEIGNALFVFGHSMAQSDDHILRLICRGKIKQLFVGLYGDEDSEQNLFIRRRVEQLQGMRGTRKRLEVEYYDARSARVWG